MTDECIRNNRFGSAGSFKVLVFFVSSVFVMAWFACPAFGASYNFSNPASITIPAGAPGTTSGPSDPYPSNINVSGITGAVIKATVTLTNLSHTYPSDVDILIVGPGGQAVLLMSDAGGGMGTAITNVTLTFDDAAAISLPGGSQITSGTYLPTNYNGLADNFNAPAPAGPYGSALSVLTGADVNGVWSFYVMDNGNGDVGSISGGWSLDITTADPVPAMTEWGMLIFILFAGSGSIYFLKRNKIKRNSENG